MVNIEGLNKADVLAALYNESKPTGMGFLQASGGPPEMDRAYAEHLLTTAIRWDGDPLYFDCLHGRPVKLDLSSSTAFDPLSFDLLNGGHGTAQRIVDRLRTTGKVTAEESFLDEQIDGGAATMFLLGALMRKQ